MPFGVAEVGAAVLQDAPRPRQFSLVEMHPGQVETEMVDSSFGGVEHRGTAIPASQSDGEQGQNRQRDEGTEDATEMPGVDPLRGEWARRQRLIGEEGVEVGDELLR